MILLCEIKHLTIIIIIVAILLSNPIANNITYWELKRQTQYYYKYNVYCYVGDDIQSIAYNEINFYVLCVDHNSRYYPFCRRSLAKKNKKKWT